MSSAKHMEELAEARPALLRDEHEIDPEEIHRLSSEIHARVVSR